jgi:hypothetical protein
MTGVEDMTTGVKGTTGAKKGAEATKNGIRNEGKRGDRDLCHRNDGTPVQGSATG